MSKRQEERAERLYAFWVSKLDAAFGRSKAIVAWDYLRARINDLPVEQRPAAFEAVADELMRLADSATDSPVHMRTSHRVANPLGALRAQTRRARTREGQLNRESPKGSTR